jgi:glutamate 5-kinase
VPSTHHGDLRAAQRLVVKVGSSSLTTADGALDLARLRALVDVIAARRSHGTQIVLVSSGAIAAGITPLRLTRRPRDLATQQAAASVGQGALVAAYSLAFGTHNLTVGQVLLTAEDVTRRSHYANARRTLDRLLDLGVVPVVNENDTVATHEIRFGDNDRLAALVAHLVHADALVLLSDVDALYDGPPSRARTSRVPLVRGPADLKDVKIGGSGSAIGSGGMATKVEAAAIATAAGITTILTSTEQAGAGARHDSPRSLDPGRRGGGRRGPTAKVPASGGHPQRGGQVRRWRPGGPVRPTRSRGCERSGQLRLHRAARPAGSHHA